MFVGLRAAFVALAGMALVAASNALPGETVAIAVPAAPQPDQSYAFKLDGSQPMPTQAVDAQLAYDFSSQLDEEFEQPNDFSGASLKELVAATPVSTDLDTALRGLGSEERRLGKSCLCRSRTRRYADDKK